jgi:hypothetical protein
MRMLLRYLAGEWYLAAGDTARAIAMFRAPFGLEANLEIGAASFVTSPYSAFRLATITWRQLLVRYDRPPAGHQAWITQARAATAP